MALRCDVPDRDEPDDCEPAVAIYCPLCAAREFGHRPETAAGKLWTGNLRLQRDHGLAGNRAVVRGWRIRVLRPWPSSRRRDDPHAANGRRSGWRGPAGLRHARQSVVRLAHRRDGSTAPDVAATRQGLAGSRPLSGRGGLLREHTWEAAEGLDPRAVAPFASPSNEGEIRKHGVKSRPPACAGESSWGCLSSSILKDETGGQMRKLLSPASQGLRLLDERRLDAPRVVRVIHARHQRGRCRDGGRASAVASAGGHVGGRRAVLLQVIGVVHVGERDPVPGRLAARFNVDTTTGFFFLGCNNVTPTTNANGTVTYTYVGRRLPLPASRFRRRPAPSSPSAC